MADIRAFKGIYYNKSAAGDLAVCICPPYDIISPEQQKELYESSPYNFVRVEFTRNDPGDTDPNSKYQHAGTSLEEWLKQGILKMDEAPAIYLYDQSFTYSGKPYRRRSIIAAVKLEEWSKMIVRPHEDTLAKPKADRLNLLRKLQANTSPILSLYEDKQKRVAKVLAAQEKKKPLLNIKCGDETHVVRAITEPAEINEIREAMANEPLYIADGHHRYESALNYSREQRASHAAAGELPSDLVMMTMVEMSDPGLVIFPTHRLISGIPQSSIEGLKAKLPVFFDIEEIPANKAEMWKKVEAALKKTSHGVPAIILAGLKKDTLLSLTLRNLAAANQVMPANHSDVYKKLDVSVLDHLILFKLLDLPPKDEGIVAFTHDEKEALSRVNSGEAQLAFILGPVNPQNIRAIADASDRMPRKSTYFYPKLPSGLIIHKIAG